MVRKNKLVLLRVDINSAISQGGKVLDQPRFIEAAQTIKKLLKEKAKIVIIAHQGRKGSADFCSLKEHAAILSKHSKSKIEYVNDLFGEAANKAISKLKPGQAILLENLRDYDEETHPRIYNNHFVNFSKKFDLFINDAFSVSHREQSSIIIPPKHIKSTISETFSNEIKKLEDFALHNNFKKTIIILGGSKVEDYFPLFKFLNNKTNKIIAGGVIGNLFLKISGINLGFEEKWFKDKGYLKLIKELSKIYNKYHSQIILPVDFALSGNKRKEVLLSQAPFNKKIMDVGHQSVNTIKNHLDNADRIIMKGPLGFAEFPQFEYSTKEVLSHISNLHIKRHIPALIGGGHLTTESYNNKNLKFSHVSLAGGASIAYLTQGKKGLPGLTAIKDNK
ncbi:MAG: phosphoglycerate kinase [Nanoarchaeota archaeon]